MSSLSLRSASCSALLWQIKARFHSFKLQIECAATGSRVPGFAIFVYRMWHCCSARLWSALSFYVGLSLWISDGEQSVFIFLKCAVLQPSPGWGDLYVPPLHISSLMPQVFISYHNPKRCTAIEFGHFLFLCVCLPLTCCQRRNSQHPATLPPATSWCATVRVMSWINMLMYKGMSVGWRWDRQFTCVWKGGSAERGVTGSWSPNKKTSCIHQDPFFFFIWMSSNGWDMLAGNWLWLLLLLCDYWNPVCSTPFLKVKIFLTSRTWLSEWQRHAELSALSGTSNNTFLSLEIIWEKKKAGAFNREAHGALAAFGGSCCLS